MFQVSGKFCLHMKKALTLQSKSIKYSFFEQVLLKHFSLNKLNFNLFPKHLNSNCLYTRPRLSTVDTYTQSINIL